MNIMEEKMRKAVSHLPDDFMSFEHYLRTLRTLNFASTPGLPYCRHQPTIGKWLGWDGFNFDTYKVHALWHDIQLIIKGDFEILYKAFIKLEPHKRSKIETDRWRIIICYPLSLQVLWKMLGDHLNDTINANAFELPTQQGFTLHHGEWKAYLRQWKSKGLNAGTDAAAWDWTFNAWMIEMVKMMRIRLTRGPPDKMELYIRLLELTYSLAFSPGVRIVLPNGMVLEQDFEGLQKSGSPNTIADNSLARFAAAILVCLLLGLPIPDDVVVGDDQLSRLIRSMIARMMEAYRILGIQIKGVDWGLEFVGHKFTDNGPIPLYLSKHLWKFKYVSDDDLATFLDSMCRLYVHSPDYQFWETAARHLGVSVYSKDYYLTWYDFEEFTPCSSRCM